jgi:hypothetical protein
MNAVQAVLTGLAALAKTKRVNHRLVVALAFMLVVAPFAMALYQLFDQQATIIQYEGQHFYDRHGVRFDFWFYKNYYYLFMTLAPYITVSTVIIGAFFLFPENSMRAYLLVLPLAFLFAKIMWLLTVNSNEDFDRVVPALAFLVAAAQIAIFILFFFDWMVARKYHGFDALCIRVIQIIRARKRKLITEEKADELLEQESLKLQTFNQQF